jgi:CheY-like chemotaxis protein
MSPEPQFRFKEPGARQSSVLSGGFRTLIVDDNPINLYILERTLKVHFSHLVADIAVASSGNAALSQLNPNCIDSPYQEVPAMPPTPTLESEMPFDLILLDIDMPGLSGVQVAEQIRNVHNDQATAIVAVTTSTQPEQQRTYEMVGMDGVVGKPIDLGVLDRVVTRALISRRTRGRPRTCSVPQLSKELCQTLLRNSSQSPDGRDASTASDSTPYDGSLSRRSSFPLSFGEIYQMNDSGSSDVDMEDLTKSLSKIDFFDSIKEPASVTNQYLGGS